MDLSLGFLEVWSQSGSKVSTRSSCREAKHGGWLIGPAESKADKGLHRDPTRSVLWHVESRQFDRHEVCQSESEGII